MPLYIKYIENLISEFKRIPGIGPKSAKRIVYFLLKQHSKDIERFAQSLLEMSAKIMFCKICFNISENEICGICSDGRRDNSKICIVQEGRDGAIIESIGIRTTRLASGLPVGGNLEYADEVTLSRAFSDRKEF